MFFRRRFLQFSLRGLLILIFLASVPLAGYVWLRARAERQAEAVATIKSLGGDVEYGGEVEDEDPFVAEGEPPLADWQRDWFGKDFFCDVVDVSQSTGSPHILGGPPLSEAEMSAEKVQAGVFWQATAKLRKLRELYVYRIWAMHGHPRALLSQFTELRDLDLCEAGLADLDLQGLDHLPHLERVFLEGNPVGDETARRLARCTNLKSLDLSDTQLTNEGLRHLSACRQLEWLAIDGTNITDDGLAHLAGLSKLLVLRLGNTPITDAGLAHLSRLTNLENVYLDDTQVAGAGLVHLQSFARLEELDLSGCPINDEGLTIFSQFDQLRMLNLSETKIPAEAFAKMRWPQGLTNLNLDRTEIGDAGLQPLLTHPTIESVGLLRTQVTREAHDEFSKQRPGILIWLGP